MQTPHSLLTITVLTAMFLNGCSLFERSSDSGYKTPQNKPAKSTRPQYSNSVTLKQLENRLSTKKEIEQYSKALPWFQSNEEKVEFLSLPDFEKRQDWLNENRFMKRPQTIQSEMQELVEAQDIALGMPQSLVKKSWGEPEHIEVSGNPLFKNERWRYNKFVSTPDGFKPEKKIVYFEGGRVVGWDVD